MIIGSLNGCESVYEVLLDREKEKIVEMLELKAEWYHHEDERQLVSYLPVHEE